MEDNNINKLEKVKKILREYKQEQLLTFYEEMDDNNKLKLLNQILDINFEEIFKLYENVGKKFEAGNTKIEPINYIDKEKMSNEDKLKYGKIGEEAIKQGKIAVVTMAGGQGSRLGHEGPKGTFYFEELNKSIFQILCEIYLKAKKDYGIAINWYIMTSEDNNEDTVRFFEDNNYFGYVKENITFFRQGKFPVVSEEGKLLLDEKGFVKEAANGHGGIFKNLQQKGIIKDMKNKGIEWIFVSGVDNILVKPIDEIFLGLNIEKNMLVSAKSLVKAYPEERVGVFCRKNGKPAVIEYTEITEEMSNKRDKKNELLYGESHILCNMFNIKAIERLENFKMPYHVAHKKITYMNENKEIIKPEKPNAYKFEGFIFDAFTEFDDMLIYRVKREEEFAPVKNKEGQDSPQTAKELYKKYNNI